MPITETLVARAVRMLEDGYRHAPAALAWARRTIREYQESMSYLLAIGFTPREVSLGADPS